MLDEDPEYAEGYQAHQEGKPHEENPYLAVSDEWDRWDQGWHDAHDVDQDRGRDRL